MYMFKHRPFQAMCPSADQAWTWVQPISLGARPSSWMHMCITVAILAQGTTHGPMRSRRPFDRGVHNAAIMFSKKIRSLPALRTDECRLRVLESFFPRLVVQPAAHMLSSGQFGHTCEKLCALVTLPPLLAQIGNDQARTTLGPPPCFHEMKNEKAWILPAAIPRRMHRISSELRS